VIFCGLFSPLKKTQLALSISQVFQKIQNLPGPVSEDRILTLKKWGLFADRKYENFGVLSVRRGF